MQNLFESARDYAWLASRSEPNAEDVVMAHAESSHGTKKLKRESRKRRRGELASALLDYGEVLLVRC